MRLLRSAAPVLLVTALAGCTNIVPGWTYAPVPSTTPAPSSDASASPSVVPSSSASASASASVEPSGSSSATVLTLSASNVAFDEPTLTAPAGVAFQISFENKDAGVPHNVAIHQGDANGAEVFKGQIFPGPAGMVYAVPALAAGTYAFVCSVHATMTGVLTVQ